MEFVFYSGGNTLSLVAQTVGALKAAYCEDRWLSAWGVCLTERACLHLSGDDVPRSNTQPTTGGQLGDKYPLRFTSWLGHF